MSNDQCITAKQNKNNNNNNAFLFLSILHNICEDLHEHALAIVGYLQNENTCQKFAKVHCTPDTYPSSLPGITH